MGIASRTFPFLLSKKAILFILSLEMVRGTLAPLEVVKKA